MSMLKSQRTEDNAAAAKAITMPLLSHGKISRKYRPLRLCYHHTRTKKEQSQNKQTKMAQK